MTQQNLLMNDDSVYQMMMVSNNNQNSFEFIEPLQPNSTSTQKMEQD